MENYERHLAESFVLHTHKSMFLTGKAGTGKTTFLKNIIRKTNKNTVVVAPTGVAAINAGGMTIHSMFQLPTSSFLPGDQVVENDRFTNRKVLAKSQRIRQDRRKVLIELDLLVIDEISMVRADLLDAVDYTLRRIRKSSEPFGGVQVLVIGDLFQLSPVVKSDEWNILAHFYDSPFFFDSHVWKRLDHLTIKLEKIYRQEDSLFVNVLNRIRNGEATKEDIDKINEHFGKSRDDKHIITLTTHNNKADLINKKALHELPGKSEKLSANITGKFFESSFPTREEIELKEGAQIMFVRNHPDGLYFNGKIGQVDKIKEDYIRVRFPESKEGIRVTKETWNNTRFKLNEETKEIEKENIGSFEQYPLRLAWAVTVHKSQGLTFDEVVLDVERSFAPGQLYVALSRCRSLEGLFLSTKIKMENVIVNKKVKQFYESQALSENIEEELEKAKAAYDDTMLLRSFSFEKLLSIVEAFESYVLDTDFNQKANALVFTKDLIRGLDNLQDLSLRFQKQLKQFIRAAQEDESERDKVKSRASEAIAYFVPQLFEKSIQACEEHVNEIKGKKGSKAYLKQARILLDELWSFSDSMYACTYRDQPVFEGKKTVVRKSRKLGKKKMVGETYTITLDMFREGMSLKEISEDRELAIGTIQSHMTKWLKEKKVSIDELLDADRLKKIRAALEGKEEKSANEIKSSASIDISYAEIRWMKAVLLLEKSDA